MYFPLLILLHLRMPKLRWGSFSGCRLFLLVQGGFPLRTYFDFHARMWAMDWYGPLLMKNVDGCLLSLFVLHFGFCFRHA